MERGDEVLLHGYELCAAINYASAPAVAVVVHNHSTHYLVLVADVTTPRDGPLMAGTGRFVKSWRYDNLPEGDIDLVYKTALDYATGMAVGFLSE